MSLEEEAVQWADIHYPDASDYARKGHIEAYMAGYNACLDMQISWQEGSDNA
jgi:hypothetical protein